MHDLTGFALLHVFLLPDASIGLCSNGSWRSVWNLEFKDDMQLIEVRGKLQVVSIHQFLEFIYMCYPHSC